MIDQTIRLTVFQLYFFAKEQLITHWLYVAGFFAFIIAGVILQIIMLRGGGHSKLSPGFNRLVGSLTYLMFFLIMLLISYWLFGTRVIDEVWIILFGILSFPATGFFLRAIGFWYY